MDEEKPGAHTDSDGLSFWMILVVLAIAGISLIGSQRIPEAYREAAKSLGEALVIAVVLAGTVDRFLKGRLVWEITSNVWQYVARHPVAPEVAEYLHDALQEAVIRRNSKLTYSIDETAGKLGVDIEIEYDAENYGNNEEAYPPGGWIGDKESRDPSFVLISCHASDSSLDFSAQDSDLVVKPDKGDRKAEPKGHETIQMRPRAKGLSYHVCLKYRLRDVKRRDTDTIVFGGPTIGASIFVKSLPAGIEFAVGDKTYTAGTSFSSSRVFLKDQHLDARWYPKT